MMISFKKYINEKFTEDSDPISDMGIGMETQIRKFLQNNEEYFIREKGLWIIVCAREGKLEYVKYLIKMGADIHLIDDWPLRMASNNGHKEVVELLLKHGADVHADNDYSLRYASLYGHKEVVELLLKHGANVHAQDDEALLLAKQFGHKDVVKVLQDHIDKENKGIVKESLLEKFTEDSDPIFDMGIGMETQIKKFVEEKGYKYNLNAALRICSKEGKTEFVKFLLEKGADVHADHDWALELASSNGHKEVVELLLQYGANVDIYDDLALRWAQIYGHKDVVKVLQDHIDKEEKGIVKESLLEKFTEDSDPIYDLQIGLRSKFKDFVKLFGKAEYKNYIFTLEIFKKHMHIYFYVSKLSANNTNKKEQYKYIEDVLKDLGFYDTVLKNMRLVTVRSKNDILYDAVIKIDIDKEFQGILKPSKYKKLYYDERFIEVDI